MKFNEWWTEEGYKYQSTIKGAAEEAYRAGQEKQSKACAEFYCKNICDAPFCLGKRDEHKKECNEYLDILHAGEGA